MPNSLENKFINHLHHHLAGWRKKIKEDFSKENFDAELAELSSDPIYPAFALNTPQYVNIRFMGRVSISIGRRLGEIYDKVPRLLASARYNLTPIEVAPKFEGLELDIGLSFSKVSNDDANFIAEVCNKYLPQDSLSLSNGIGIEIRYNFNPNDSSRLRKDVDMATKVRNAGLTPVYLVFSSISPRDEAIARLQRAGWIFLVGKNALNFATDLLGLDLGTILERPAVKAKIEKEIGEMMEDIKTSYAFSQF